MASQHIYVLFNTHVVWFLTDSIGHDYIVMKRSMQDACHVGDNSHSHTQDVSKNDTLFNMFLGHTTKPNISLNRKLCSQSVFQNTALRTCIITQ